MRPIRGGIWLLALVSLAKAVAAEESEGVAPGTRVRVTAERRLVGRLLAMDAEGLTLEVAGSRESVQVPRSALTRLEVSSRPSRKGKGALIGAGLGFAIGGAAALAVFSPPENDLCNRGDNGCKLKGLLAGGIALGAIGAGIGAVVAPGERWEPVATDRFRISIAPSRGGGIGAAVSFGF